MRSSLSWPRPGQPHVRRLLCLAALAVGVSACGGGAPASSPKSGQPVPITITQGGAVGDMPSLVAQQEGIFARHGLQVQFSTIQNSTQSLTALLSGSLDFAHAAPNPVMVANDKDVQGGNHVTCVVGTLTREVIQVVVRAGYSTPHASAPYPEMLTDLKGAKIGVGGIGAYADILLRGMLKDARMDPSRDVTIVPVGGPPQQIAAIKAKQVDAVMTYDPAAFVMQRSKDATVLLNIGLDSRVPARLRTVSSGCWIVPSREIAQRKAVVTSFHDAIKDAVTWMHQPQNEAAAARMVAPTFGMSDGDAQSLLKDDLPTIGWEITPEMVSNTASFLVGSGQISKAPALKDVLWTP